MISTVDVLKVASKRTKPLPKFPQFARVLELSVVDLPLLRHKGTSMATEGMCFSSLESNEPPWFGWVGVIPDQGWANEFKQIDKGPFLRDAKQDC